MKKFFKQKNKACPAKLLRSEGFTRLVDFGDAPTLVGVHQSASPKLTTGFTLVETLVAISVFSMSIIALMSILGGGISNTNYAKMKITASYLAQEGIEYVRNMRDEYVLYDPVSSQNGWNEFKVDADNMTFPITEPEFSDFTRAMNVDIVTFGSDEVKVSSTVSWTQGSGDYSITFSENLFNWIEI